MGLSTYYNVAWAVSAIALLVVIVDQAYQRFSHKLTGEPPLLPYRIPIVGHALMFSSNAKALYKTARYVTVMLLLSLGCIHIIPIVITFPATSRIPSCFLASEYTCVYSFLDPHNAPTVWFRLSRIIKTLPLYSVKQRHFPFCPSSRVCQVLPGIFRRMA